MESIEEHLFERILLSDSLGVVLLLKGFVLELNLEDCAVRTFADFDTGSKVCADHRPGFDTAASPIVDQRVRRSSLWVMLTIEARSDHCGLSEVSLLEQQASY